ncbi:hypothetical protein C8245_22955 [Paracidovorax avenae]|uniref:hypothetical protein n=1 Tax=Paracidovorax avenae TaxID=80867 RepID=UPI000D1FFC58|nr:hypothetical protein [Paracidovorax avenae]AVS68139.1 hypothetical protein C8245_22955 [Paracidovorax avenae]
MTTKAVQDFLDSADIDGPLTPEQAAQLMRLAESGDEAGAQAAAQGGAPATTPAQEGGQYPKEAAGAGETAAPAPQAGASEGQGGAKAAESTTAKDESTVDPANAVVLAKDGKHHIPYSQLEKARQDGQHWRTEAEAAQRKLTELQAQAQQRADAGAAPTRQDNMVAAAEAAIASGQVDAEIFGDFSEAALAEGIRKLVAMQVAEALKPVQDREAAARETAQRNAQSDHAAAILAKHPDATSIVGSTQLEEWINSRPAYEQVGIRHVLDNGETKDVIELFDKYKAATGTSATPASAPAVPDVKAAAKAAAEAARSKPPVPETLSGFPGARTGATSVQDQLDSLDAPGLANAMGSMSPAQIEAFLNRTL